MGEITKRCQMSKSELPQSSLGSLGVSYPRFPIPLEPPPVLSESVEPKSSVQ